MISLHEPWEQARLGDHLLGGDQWVKGSHHIKPALRCLSGLLLLPMEGSDIGHKFPFPVGS